MRSILLIVIAIIANFMHSYAQKDPELKNNWAKLQSGFVKYIRYPKDLEKASIPSFFTLKVQYDEKAKQYNLEFSDSAHPLMIKEVLRIKDKLDFNLVYDDLTIEKRDIPIIIPIEIRLARVSREFSDPKSTVSQNLYNFKGKQAFGNFYFYAPLALTVIND